MKSAPRILLVSNSTVYGRGYLDHVEQEIKAFLGDGKRMLICENGAVTLRGEAGARIFRHGAIPVEAKTDDNIVRLIGEPNGN